MRQQVGWSDIPSPLVVPIASRSFIGVTHMSNPGEKLMDIDSLEYGAMIVGGENLRGLRVKFLCFAWPVKVLHGLSGHETQAPCHQPSP